MRIESIQLSWFRGAADPITLETGCKSMVIYGGNGSGKSSFVDAVEYILNEGRINHLAHEYSGRHQEKAIHNTHKPSDQKTYLEIRFQDGSELRTEISESGTYKTFGAKSVAMSSWNYRRTVLRQDEVATFVHDTKGNKYSALSPLLGLDHMNYASENLRLLNKQIELNSELKNIRANLQVVEKKRTETYGTASIDQILERLKELHLHFFPDNPLGTDALSWCKNIEKAIRDQSAEYSSEFGRYSILQSLSKLKLTENIKDVRKANSQLANIVETLLLEKLEVLQSTSEFINGLKVEKVVKCPACGQSILVDSLKKHIEAEHKRLQEIIDLNSTRKKTITALFDTVKMLKSNVYKQELRRWCNEQKKGELEKNFIYLDTLNIEPLRNSCDEDTLNLIDSNLTPIINAAGSSSKKAPKSVQNLIDDKEAVEVGKSIIESQEEIKNVEKIEDFMNFLSTVEASIRDEIRVKTEVVINEISVNIQRMWEILHPNKKIEEVRLYLPEDIDKAIDISLKFYGLDQPSPRLTLSEGYRNSLGLSIFLSMAKRTSEEDLPIILDDVIVSLDREHRGMVADLLLKEFEDRQVIIFTHDRDWYSELRHQLDGKKWIFQTFLPYETPDIGIRWSHNTNLFDDARAHIENRPDSAGNDVRKIMDVELAFISERLQINFPYIRGDKNDKRMAHEFLERLIGTGKKCFEKKNGNGDYLVYAKAINALDRADKLIVSWANRASHSFDLHQAEAKNLIDTCEEALKFFKCSACKKNVWFADAKSSKLVQCQCGEIRWRYGKAS